VITSDATYAPYVIGDQQAEIHKKRWLTAAQAAKAVADRGELDTIVQRTLERINV
jgi:hypothetical protein